MLRLVVGCPCLLTFFSLALLAQVEFTGQVRTPTNTPLPGTRITVTIRSGEPVQVFSDPSGKFSLQVQEAGPYEILSEKDGHYPARAKGTAGVSEVVELSLTLHPVGIVSETVDVAAIPVSLDMDSASEKRSLSSAELMNIPYPNTNDLKNAARSVPGVVRDARGGLHVNGSSEEQLLVTLNGFNLNDPLTGRFDSRMSVESVQSVEVNSGNLAAEYGKGSGGVLAIRSQSGGDKLRYSATNFVPGFENRKGWILGDWTPRFGVSGPLYRGKAWFSNSSDVQYIQTVVRDLPKGEDRTSGLRLSNLLTGQVNLSPSHILHAGFLFNNWNSARTGLTAVDPRETTIDRRSRQFFFHVKDQFYFRGGALIEAGFAANRTYGREIPQGQELLAFTPEGKRGNYYVDGTRHASRDQFLANAFLPSFNFFGSHQLKIGSDLNHLSYTQDVRRTGFENFSETGYRTRRTVFAGSGAASKQNDEAGLYLQDSWRPLQHLLVEAGLRADWDRLIGQWNASPRLGAAWSPGRLHNTKIYGGLAQIYDASNLRIFTRPDDQYSLTSYFDPDGRLNRGPAVSVFRIGTDPLVRPRAWSWTTGAAHAFASGVTVRADLLRRRGDRGFTYQSFVPPSQDEAIKMARAVNAAGVDSIYYLGNGRIDTFDSASVTIRHAIRRQYEWMASYTRSRARSNAVVDISQEEPIVASENAGPLPWDAPHRFLSYAYLPLPRKNWAIAYFLDRRTGFPFSTLNEDGRVVGKVNAQRFPAFFELNLHLERRFAFRGHRWAFRFGANNLTNRVNPDSVNSFLVPGRPIRFYGGTGRSFNVRIRWLGRAS